MACSSLEKVPVPVARRPDAGLLQPCEGATAQVSPRPTTKEVSLAWLDAERLLVLCIESKNRLIDFYLERNPLSAPAVTAPAIDRAAPLRSPAPLS